jgi:hypothetical protein
MRKMRNKTDQLHSFINFIWRSFLIIIAILAISVGISQINKLNAQTFQFVYAMQNETVIDSQVVSATTCSFKTLDSAQVIRELYIMKGFFGDNRHDGVQFLHEVDTVQAEAGSTYLVTYMIPRGYKAIWYLNNKPYAATRQEVNKRSGYKRQ